MKGFKVGRDAVFTKQVIDQTPLFDFAKPVLSKRKREVASKSFWFFTAIPVSFVLAQMYLMFFVK